MKKMNRVNIALLLPILVVVNGLVFAQQAIIPPSPVQVEEVKNTLFTPTMDIVGTIFSRHNVKLTAGVSGQLEWVAEPGTFLQLGDVVARIDTLPLTLQQAEQQTEIKRAQINQEYLKRELKRLTELRQTNSASAFQLDQTQSQYDLALADLEIAQLKLQQIDEQLRRTVVRAPFTGVITERAREAGGEVSRAEILVHMLDTENLEGRIFVPVKYLPFIRQSKQVTVSASNIQLQASIKAIIPAADARSQSFELRVSLPAESNQYWTAGQLIRASLPVQAPKEALTVHRDALILRQDGIYVVVIDAENKAHKLMVTVGEGQDDWVSISTDKVNAGDRVATRGAERLKDGQVVEVAKPTV
jgi:RND family efflux transporter MFP subunit